MIRSSRTRLAAGILTVGAVGIATAVSPHASGKTPLTIASTRPLAGPDSGDFPGAQVPLGDLDHRGARLQPLISARTVVRSLGSGVQVSWNQYGTPLTLTKPGGWIGTGYTGAPADAARQFLSVNHDLFGLSTADVAGLELWRDNTLAESTVAHAVLFRQHASGIPLAQDGLVIVGIRSGKVASITSSIVPTAVLGTLASTTPQISGLTAVLAGLKDAGITPALTLPDLHLQSKVDAAGFSHIVAKGLPQQQLFRIRALPTTDQGVRLVFDTVIEDVAGGLATATNTYVDAITGKVLYRHDAVNTYDADSLAEPSMRQVSLPEGVQQPAATNANQTGPISGAYTATGCGAPVPVTVDAGTTTMVVTAAAVGANAADDIVINVYKNGVLAGTGDTATSPEVATVTFAPAISATDKVTVAVCPYDTGTAPYTWSGAYVASDSVPAASTGSTLGAARWKFFQDSPELGPTSKDNRAVGCSGFVSAAITKDATCDVYLNNPSNLAPYDVLTAGAPTLSTTGNNAVTTNAQYSTSLTPGPPAVPYVDPDRSYDPVWDDSWNTTKCDPTQLTAGQSDANIDAAMVNLFVGHNRLHDFAYRLGLNDYTGSLQATNASGNGTPGDPEEGNTQNAAATNPVLTVVSGVTTPTAGLGVTGRDNANQITEADGVPGITNQYLFQPLLGFYSPCTDGDLDSTVFLHEYTHAISNRLIAGPDTGLSGQEGGSMGESWSDLDALEFLTAAGVAGKQGEDPYALGASATGNATAGIRDYNLKNNPLTYGEFGFDTTGPEVHADGEIWNGIQIHVRQAMIDAYEAKYPYENTTLQKQCALGVDAVGTPASGFEGCPGNRRWIQYMYDSLILQANGAPSMVDMKNTTLAADMLRTGGVDQKTLSEAFASRGLGANSSAKDGDDTDPIPGFASPYKADNAHVTFAIVDEDTGAPIQGSVYVGTYTARATPLASTIPGKQPATADMTPADYQFVVQAPGYGIQRFKTAYRLGETKTQTFKLPRNVASAASGATATGSGSVRPGQLIDDSEATDTGYSVTPAAGDLNPVKGKSWTIALNGLQTVSVLNVSAMHHPVDANDANDFQARITDLRSFDVMGSSDGGATYHLVYSSPDDFFPATTPRNVAPMVALRSVTLPAPVKVDHLQLVVRASQCTGQPLFNQDIDNDPLNDPTCNTSTNAGNVTVADFQAFAKAPTTNGPSAVVAVPPATAPVTTKVITKTVIKTVTKTITVPGSLAATGSSTWLPLTGAALLIASGTGLAVSRRRRFEV